MPRVPQIVKCHGDNEISIKGWPAQFEAHLNGLGIKDKHTSWRNLLICYLDEIAFTVASNTVAGNADLTYMELKNILKDKFSGSDYRRALECKLHSLKFSKVQKRHENSFIYSRVENGY